MDLSQKTISENHITTLMITHNMQDALKYGNRLIMMKEGRIIFDIAGKEKSTLQVKDLLEKFQSVNEVINDSLLLV